MKNLRITTYLLAGLLLLGFTACEEDEAIPVRVNFSNTEAGISQSSPSADIEISFSRPAEADGSLSISIASETLTYGESADFYTSPLATENVITLPYTVGDESVLITVMAGSALNIEQDESITLTVSDPAQILDLGDQTEFTVMFSENFVALSGTVVLDAGGPTFSHQAYFDLSKITQTKVDKYTWDLGFSTAGDHRVIINNPAKMMAQQIDKNDLTKVTAQDTVGFGAAQNFGAYNGDAVDWVDAPDGDLDSLALNKVLATATDNKVYIVNREGDGRNWKKIRILQNGTGYTVQYADIASSTFQTADITVDESYNFSFFDLDNGATTVEPEKNSWDLMYGSFTNVVNFGYNVPYAYNDYVIINRNNTEVAEIVLADNVSYDGYALSDAQALTLTAAQNAIGSNWRNGGSQTTAPSLKEDRFYVIKDAADNYYKLKFTSMLSAENGDRGYTSIQYQLLK
ncbi:HmuY family protein [Reichenbachiella carrageenanivorans]|uniref:HmuY family protein n=1 Tax=Reichenbachiella carrageenanivorans TaxID=2979869 RepID=A0ABY6D4J3_9BACT|nr:HmuY family protein [Reichenbachiella carrageenanivorans]UXX81074.1 HmuY family protein [Reichenbachiella carrageenanivorans]